MLYLIHGKTIKAIEFSESLLKANLVSLVNVIGSVSDDMLSVKRAMCNNGSVALVLDFTNKHHMEVVDSMIQKHGLYKVTRISVEE